MTENLEELMVLHCNLRLDYSREERNIISVGFKNNIGHFQGTDRVLKSISESKRYEKYLDQIMMYRLKGLFKLMEQCEETAKIMNEKGFRVATDAEAVGWWKKLTADYYRYAYEACDEIIEIKNSPVMHDIEQALEADQEGKDLWKQQKENAKTAAQKEKERLEKEEEVKRGEFYPEKRRYETVHQLEVIQNDYRDKA